MNIINRKKIFFVLPFILLVLNYNTFSQDKEIILGGKSGWGKFQNQNGVTKGKGRFGYECIKLATNSRRATEDTDLLLSFEDSSFKDKTENYKVVSNTLVITDEAIMGHSAALSRGAVGGLILKGGPRSLFGSQGKTGSFEIEFWLRPSVAENGEIVFSWKSSRIVEDYVFYQLITASFFNNRLEWNFTNIFDGYSNDNGEIRLLSYSAIIPDRWAHHTISFDEETGLLEYRINGQLEALKYITVGSREGNTIFQPVLGLQSEIHICPKLVGTIDDFRIVRKMTGVEEKSQRENYSLKYDTYKIEGGSFESEPIMVSAGSTLKSLDIIDTVPPQTEIRYYVRAGNNFFNWNTEYPKWTQVKSAEQIKGITGRYFQVAAEFFPDGNGEVTPSVTQIKLNYQEAPLPTPPFKIYAKPGDGSVDLSWTYSVDETAGGYYIYYGSRPGEYLGREAEQGSSPIKVNNITDLHLTGLQNGLIYYFAISTYSKLDDNISGSLSKEVYARPGKK